MPSPTHHDIAKTWVAGSKLNAKGHHMYFAGRTIYSYGSHFPIATLVDVASTYRVALFTTQGRSTSTTNHKFIVRRALRTAGVRTFLVPDVTASSPLEHAFNYRDMLAEVRDVEARASRARTLKDFYMKEAAELRQAAADYRSCFLADVSSTILVA